MLLSMRNYPAMSETDGESDSGGGASDNGSNYSGGDFNMEEASAQLAQDVFGTEPDEQQDDGPDEIDAAVAAEATPKEEAQPAVQKKAPPSSWSKEKHAVWEVLPPEAQDYVETREKQMREGVQAIAKDAEYGRQLAESIAPYKSLIQAQGLDDVKAVKYLLNAHHILTNAPADQKSAYLQNMARSYGITLAQGAEGGAQSRQVDPTIRRLEQELNQIKGHLTQSQMAAHEARSNQVANEVTEFAQDEKHPYFDECADDIVVFINAGMSLQEAYDRAVRSNPVTYAKEQARITAETEAKLRERAKKQGVAARTASKTNLNGRDTHKAPTANKGTIDDVMRDTYAQILARQQ